MDVIIASLSFAVPIYIANGGATLSRSIPLLKSWTSPLDFEKEISGKRILGKGKTFRGLLFGTFLGTLFGFLYYCNFTYFHSSIQSFSNLSCVELLQLSFLLSLGALIGDIVKSFAKRRIGITSGRPWFPFDQLDFIVGGILYGSIVFFPGWTVVIILLIISPLLHFLSNIVAYMLKLKDVWW